MLSTNCNIKINYKLIEVNNITHEDYSQIYDLIKENIFEMD
jgi:hypothetical protein